MLLGIGTTLLGFTQMRFERGVSRGGSWMAFTAGVAIATSSFAVAYFSTNTTIENALKGLSLCAFAFGFVLFSRETRLIKELEEGLRIDSLTRLPNKRAFSEHVQKEFARAVRTSRSFGICVFDIDEIDLYDSETQEAGLQRLAGVVSSRLRATDVAARIGGSHCALLLVDTDTNGAMIAANRVRETFERSYQDDPTGNLPPMTVSCGVAAWSAEDTEAEDCFKHAELALYQMRRTRTNDCHVFSPSEVDQELERLVSSL